MTYLGIDLGTSGLRALLTDEDGAPLASTERHYQARQPHPGWSEQDPAEWIAAVEDAVQELRQTPGFDRLHGVGVAGHMHGACVLDADDKVLRPCILWNDARASAEAARLDTDDNRALSGNIVFPGFTAPKLAWLRTHEPETFAKIAKVLLPAAYLNLYLTGDHVADLSDSAGTAWLDTGKRDWSDRLLAASHMTRAQMPRLVEGCDAAGQLRPELARKWGIARPVTVAGGAGDNAAAACGMGALQEGQGFVSLGTSGVLLTARDGYSPAPASAVHTFCHAVPDRWYQMGVMLAATDSLNWLSRITGAAPAELTANLGPLQPPGHTRFLPYLSGERTPHNDTEVRGAFTGLSTVTTRDDLTRAVFAGVAFGLRDSLEALQSTGARLPHLIAIGGGARSEYWLRLIATVLNLPLLRPASGEFGAALGAARLARSASGADWQAIMTPPQIAATMEPEPTLTEAFSEAYRSFKSAYPAIRAAQ